MLPRPRPRKAPNSARAKAIRCSSPPNRKSRAILAGWRQRTVGGGSSCAAASAARAPRLVVISEQTTAERHAGEKDGSNNQHQHAIVARSDRCCTQLLFQKLLF